MLGHAEFLDTDEFDSFLRVISSENLPKLQYLVSFTLNYSAVKFCFISFIKLFGSEILFQSSIAKLVTLL